MKRSLKITIIVSSVIVAIVLLVAVLISPVAKWYVEKHSKELTGRIIRMEKLRINIFTGGMRMEGFRMLEADDSALFVGLGKLRVDVKLWSLLSSDLVVDRIELSKLDVNLWQKGDVFNFSDMLEKFASDSTETPADTVPSEWTVGLYNISLDSSSLVYRDLLVGSTWDMNNMKLMIPGVYFGGKSTDVGVTLNFSNGGSLSTKLAYDIERSNYDLNVKLNDFNLDNLLPYMQEYMNISGIKGLLSSDVNIVGNVDHVMESHLNGTLALNGFSMTDTQNRNVVSLQQFTMGIDSIDLQKADYRIGAIYASGFSTEFDMYRDSTNNFTTLMKPQSEPAVSEPDTAGTSGDMNVTIRKIDVENSTFRFVDNTLKRPFDYTITALSLRAENLDPAATNNIEIGAKFPGGGNALVKWKGRFDSMSDMSLVMTIKNMDIRQFTPYSMEYFAYPVNDGVLSFVSKNVVSGNMLDGDNKIDIFKGAVGKRVKSENPEYKVPLRTALYIIKDVHDRIKFDVPVQGNVNSPEFSYKKIIIKTIVNLLVKVAVSPFNFLGNSLGISSDKMSTFYFDPVLKDFSSEQYHQLNDIATVLKERPELVLTMKQGFNVREAVTSMALFNIKKGYYLAQHPDRTEESLELIELQNIAAINNKDPQLTAYADTLKAGNAMLADLTAKALAVYPPESMETQIRELVMYRNGFIRDYLKNTHQVDSLRIRISVLPKEQLEAYKGRSRFSVTMALDGDEETIEAAGEETVADTVSGGPAGSLPVNVPDSAHRELNPIRGHGPARMPADSLRGSAPDTARNPRLVTGPGPVRVPADSTR